MLWRGIDLYIQEESFEKINGKFVLERIHTQTPYGNKAKKAMPVFLPGQEEDLNEELDWLEEIMDKTKRHREAFAKVFDAFHRIKDLDGSFRRVKGDEILTVPELFEIKNLVFSLRDISQAISHLKWKNSIRLVEPMKPVEDLLDPEGQRVGTFYLYDSYSPDLASVRQEQKVVDDALKKRQKKRRADLETELKISIRANDETTISKENKTLIEKIQVHGEFLYSAETYMNVTFRVKSDEKTDQLKQRYEKLLQKEEEIGLRIREELTQKLKVFLPTFYEMTFRVGMLDLAIAKASFFKGFSCVRPVISSEKDILEIDRGRYLPVETQLKKKKQVYTPVSLTLTSGVTCITGANMGGKTITLKMVGSIVWMTQMALFVPAEAAEVSLRDFLLVSIGDDQDTNLGLSTFGAEIVNVTHAISASSRLGLILIDELARGTNPKEGYALSMAILETLKTKPTMTLVTTHFDGLADQKDVTHLQVRGLQDVDFKSLKQEIEGKTCGMEVLHELMDYRLKPIHSSEDVPKDAVHIAQLMGLDEKTLKRAKTILVSLANKDK